MQKLKKSLTKILTGVALTGLVFNFTACSDNSPLSSDEKSLNAKNNMQIIEFENVATSLKKTTAFEVITPEDGGRLVLVKGPAFLSSNSIEVNLEEFVDEDSLEILGFGHQSGVFVSLTVLPQSVKDTTKISVTLENNSIDMEFGPHGTVFQNPAVLNIVAVGLKLKNVNTETLDVYYDDPYTGQWERMDAANITVSEKSGYIRIQDARIPHFSRYAVAWSR